MNKLQLYITKSFDGYKVLFNINPAEEISRHIREIRRIVEKVNYDSTEKNIFYYVTNIDGGTFVTIIRTIPTAPVDHLAAWIYVPGDLVIDGPTLERVINQTTRKISGERVTTDDVTNLRELFATEYMTDPNAPAVTASKAGGPIGWRRYNVADTDVTLSTLLGPGLFQLPYLDYAGVLFIDNDLGITADAVDLTDTPINGPAVIIPAPQTAEHFIAHFFGRPIETPIRATVGTPVKIVWKHQGFEDVVVEEVIEKGEFEPAVPDTSNSRKSVTLASFQVMTQTGRVPLDDCTITVNGMEISDKPTLFTTAELASAIVSINCEGYAPYSAKMDLAASTRALVRLQERTKIYCFEMPVKSAALGAPIRFKLYSKKPVTESPLEGYTAQDSIIEGESRTNHLAYSGGSPSMRNKAVYCGIGLIVGLVIGWLTGCGGGEKAPSHVDTLDREDVEVVAATISEVPVQTVQPQQAASQPQQQQSQQPAQQQAAASTDKPVNNNAVTAEALAYLDNNTTWTKEGLEKYPALRGLFDDMYNFRLEKLTGDWATKLQNSKRFATVAQHARYGMSQRKKEKSKIDGATYPVGKDNSIAVQSYLNRIDP